MYAKQIVSAIAAISLASGAAAVSCKDTTATIQSPADATTIAACQTVAGSVTIDSSVAGVIDLSGQLTEIGGDFIVKNNSGLVSLSSSSLRKIGGTFQLEQVKLLSTLNFATLSSVKAISWVSLNQLGSYTTTGNGIIAAEKVVIADTFLDTLDGINIRSLRDMDINNNRRLTKFTTQLNNLTNTLNINANGRDLEVNMPNLYWIANATISNVTSFSAQSLAAVNGSIRFDSNYFESFIAPNLTQIQTGDLSFVSNGKLTNISFPLLEKVGGGFTIANNTALEKIDGFPALTVVGGAVKLRGSFNEVSLPKLNDVKGAFDASSTQSIQTSCDTLNKLKSSGKIQGGISCTSNNQNANNDTSSAGGSTGGGSGGGTSNKPGNGASPLSISMSTVVSLAAVGALVTAFL